MATKKPTKEPLGKRTTAGDVYGLIMSEVIPRLTRVEAKVENAGLNGHSELLKEFLEKAGQREASRAARNRVFTDIKNSVGWLARPRDLAKKGIGTVLVATVSAYISAVLWGKLPPPWPFHR